MAPPAPTPHLRWSAYLAAVTSWMGLACAPKKRTVRKRWKAANSACKAGVSWLGCRTGQTVGRAARRGEEEVGGPSAAGSRAALRRYAHCEGVRLQAAPLGQLGHLHKPVLETARFGHAPVLNWQRIPTSGGGCANVGGSGCGDEQPLHAAVFLLLLHLLQTCRAGVCGRFNTAARRICRLPSRLPQHVGYCSFEAQWHAQTSRGLIRQRCKVRSRAKPLQLQRFHGRRGERPSKLLTG